MWHNLHTRRKSPLWNPSTPSTQKPLSPQHSQTQNPTHITALANHGPAPPDLRNRQARPDRPLPRPSRAPPPMALRARRRGRLPRAAGHLPGAAQPRAARLRAAARSQGAAGGWDTEIRWNDDVPVFPFIATCLCLGASISGSGRGANVHNLPFNMRFDGGDNNDGITVLDITDPSAVRYAFVFLKGTHSENFQNTPLTAYEYLADYDRPHSGDDSAGDDSTGDETEWCLKKVLQRRTVIDTEEISAPLIDEAALESAWPASWQKRTDLKLPGIPAQLDTAPQVHTSGTSISDDSLRALYDGFVRSYQFLDPLFEESSETTRARTSVQPHIKQIIYIEALHDAREEQLSRVWTFPVDDTPLTGGWMLDVVYRWLDSTKFSEAREDTIRPQNMVKLLSLAESWKVSTLQTT